MDTNNSTGPRLSVSGIRRYSVCGYAYKLHRDGVPERVTAAIWYERLMHRMLEHVYQGVTPIDAHWEVWKDECGSILSALERWSDLHLAYLQSGIPHSKARAAWLVDHPDYTVLATRLAVYQSDVLNGVCWTCSASLQDRYLRSRTLARTYGDELRVGGAVLIAGRMVAPLPTSSTFTSTARVSDEDGGYALLRGTIGSATVVGIPDVVAYCRERDCWRIGDYKTNRSRLSPAVLRDDAQLNLYRVLLHQAGVIPRNARVEVGQIYLTERVESVWVDVSDRAGTVSLRLRQQVEQTGRLVEAGIFMPVKGLLNGPGNRCAACSFAHCCDA
jgi:hypothetical protein